MAIPTRTLDEIVRRGLAHTRSAFPDKPVTEKKYLGRVSRATSKIIWGGQKAAEDASRDIVPSSQMSTDMLTEYAFLLGLPDGEGGYGRFLPTVASGGQASITGVKGTIFPDGTTATSADGSVQIELSGAVTIAGTPPGFGSAAAIFVAITPGTGGNLPIGSILTWDSPPAGADSTFTLTAALGGGTSLESDSDVLARITQRLQQPPRGGVAEDYREWIAVVDGIVYSYVYPKRSGTGTVDVVITAGGSGQSRVPSAAQLDAAQAALDANRPAGAEAATALLPYMPNGAGHAVKVEVVPASTQFNFDWDDTTGPFTVDLYSPGPAATLRLNTLAPVSLKGAIDAYNAGTGLAPRLQVISTGVAVNPGIRAVAWVDGGGKTTLTLETVPSGWTGPTVGDAVYAYGPVVGAIANGILDFVDSLGPSRASGFADDLTPWRDSIALSGIIAVAENAIDSDGAEMIAEVPPGGATIDGIADDVDGSDGINGPELLYLASVAVVRAP